jgi:hypothetical protein
MFLQRLLTFICVATICSSAAVVGAEFDQPQILQAAKNIVDSRKSSLGGIRFGLSEKQVMRQFGKPQNRKIGMNCGDQTIKLTYKNIAMLLFIDAEKSQVFKIETASRLYRTDQGIRVGDSIEKAKAAYPSLLLVAANGSKDWISLESQFLMTVNDQGKITKILMGVNSDC